MDIRNFFSGGGGGSSTKKSTNSNDKKSDDSADKKKIAKTMEQIANDRSPDDSDTDMDDNATSGNIGGGGMNVARNSDTGKKEATNKSNGAPSKQVDSDASTDDEDVVQIKKKKKPPQASPIKKRKALDDNGSSDDDLDNKVRESFIVCGILLVVVCI